MTANVNIEIARRTDVLRVPNAALRFRPTNDMYAALGLDPACRPTRQAGGGRGAATRRRAAGGRAEGAQPARPPRHRRPGRRRRIAGAGSGAARQCTASTTAAPDEHQRRVRLERRDGCSARGRQSDCRACRRNSASDAGSGCAARGGDRVGMPGRGRSGTSQAAAAAGRWTVARGAESAATTIDALFGRSRRSKPRPRLDLRRQPAEALRAPARHHRWPGSPNCSRATSSRGHCRSSRTSSRGNERPGRRRPGFPFMASPGRFGGRRFPAAAAIVAAAVGDVQLNHVTSHDVSDRVQGARAATRCGPA